MSQLQHKIKIQETVTTNLSNENLRLQNAINKLQTVDANEQHDRNIKLVLHGVPEKKDENTTTKFVQLVNKHLAYKIKPDDIHRSHRLGRYTSDKDKNPRPIIARFFD